jgi:hypothetical protein
MAAVKVLLLACVDATAELSLAAAATLDPR